jgi:hypothetical protein
MSVDAMMDGMTVEVMMVNKMTRDKMTVEEMYVNKMPEEQIWRKNDCGHSADKMSVDKMQ